MDAMLASIPEYRKTLKETAPALVSIKIDEDDIRVVI
jgi:polyribonucleotide nucleotidyltransferase